jgi:hypothetical protein
MKKKFTPSTLFFLMLLFSMCAQAQNNSDQNPDYAVSRKKYMAIADSVNQLHSTTLQQTYKAFDWYEAKMERRQNREAFRRELRLERARGSNYYNRNYGYQSPYYVPYNNGYYRNNRHFNFRWW